VTRRLARALALAGALLGCDTGEAPPAPPSAPPQAAPAPAAPPGSAAAPEAVPARYVGSARCAECHPEAAAAWRGSHHDRAMEAPAAGTVLGDFDDAVFTAEGRSVRFHRRDGSWWVETEGPDGTPAAFEVAWTFGVEPLQQVLLRLPDGRLQALDVAWDTRPAAEGGQRWFPLQPDASPPPGDPMHWTGLAWRWNAQCAECHSTGVRRGWRADEARYETRFLEEDVGCEACHGPGAAHVAWAEAGEGGDPRLAVALHDDGGRWTRAPDAAIAERVPPRDDGTELDVCAPCHARRSLLEDAQSPGAPFLDGHRPALLDPGLYHADGQILDEVYVWGSFLQSRMHAAGVTCSDCHDPHSLAVADPPEATCARCHAPEVFATPAHHHHPAGSAGASCLACHMPARTYMGIDARRDHSFRVPRPDLSARLGTPDACTGCHTDHDAAWARDAAARWWGEARAGREHYGETLQAGREGVAGAGPRLLALAADPAQPAIVRASALRLAGANPSRNLPVALARAARDPDALLRLAAAGAAEALPPELRAGALAPLLDDPRRAVRLEAAFALAGAPARRLDPDGRRALAAALEEYRAAQQGVADRPEAHASLAALQLRLEEPEAARASFERALALGPWFVPARLGLAELERRRGREGRAEALLRQALEWAPEEATVHHALGLSLVRQGRSAEALEALARAAALAPGVPRFAYVHGVALHSAGEPERALDVLEQARARHPGDAALLQALATMHRDAGHREVARRHARALAALRPDDPEAARLLHELEGAASEEARP